MRMFYTNCDFHTVSNFLLIPRPFNELRSQTNIFQILLLRSDTLALIDWNTPLSLSLSLWKQGGRYPGRGGFETINYYHYYYYYYWKGGSGVGPRPAIGQKAAVVQPLGSIISKMARTFHETYSTNVSIAFFVLLLPMTSLVPPTPLFFNLVEFPREKSNALNVRGDFRKNLSEWPVRVHSSQRLVIACY